MDHDTVYCSSIPQQHGATLASSSQTLRSESGPAWRHSTCQAGAGVVVVEATALHASLLALSASWSPSHAASKLPPATGAWLLTGWSGTVSRHRPQSTAGSCQTWSALAAVATWRVVTTLRLALLEGWTLLAQHEADCPAPSHAAPAADSCCTATPQHQRRHRPHQHQHQRRHQRQLLGPR